ncbi:ascorbate-specific PTS system EIIA component [Escherichia coli]|nr:ascorbate-specific PTS system EIIA component [Escherichia coli]CTU46356.1 ascorbate-specific PTS system EIIA component [Escherichia coli]CTU84257.1 ascorbate-specific PTS system EIIA component [Escherichia coli]CTV59975.1 ascorbate-specific PTS system EIIA component [Escherichia coli]CTW94186.1 ascorbate-specific PTS system EIIA component [Escherichia coli]
MKLRDSLAENKSIRLQAEAETWQDAVKIGVDLLVAADVVEPRYYQAILDAVEQHGPYFVLAPGLAMPHGRPEEGVKKTGFALVTLKKPLEFNHEDNDPVDILITMARLMPTLTRKWASCRSLTCLKMKRISTVYAPAVPSRKYWI